jgi:DNA helicase-2/ATP-dependent DNA helicase PcrA
VENVQELMNSMQGFIDEQQQLDDGDASLSNFLENITLSTSQDKKSEDQGPEVSLMTIHLSKGLEFPIVYVVGLEENLFPSFMSSSTREDLEEERRLFYVALTRAEKQAYFSYAISRFQWGKITDCEPSRFLSEVDAHFLEMINPMAEKKTINRSGLSSSIFDEVPSAPKNFKKVENSPKKKLNLQSEETQEKKQIKSIESARIISPSGNSSEEISAGDRVRHDRFGIGNVIFIDGTDPNNIKAKVEFLAEGEKNLILKYAKLIKL